MNKRQTAIIRHMLLVLAVTVAFIFALINIRDAVNKSIVIEEMRDLAGKICKYRAQHDFLPPESWLRSYIADYTRLSDLQYRVMCISFFSPPETILCYEKRVHTSMLVGSGYAVMRLSGEVEWMDVKTFQELYKSQLTERELMELEGK